MDRVARIANGLAAAQLGSGDRIAAMAVNAPQFIEVIAGCVRAGGRNDRAGTVPKIT